MITDQTTAVEPPAQKHFKKHQPSDKPSQGPKKKVRCKHFPNCMNTDEDCPFVHPKDDCKYFPACTNGDKCIYLHPEIDCKFALQCTRQNCAYKHPKGHRGGGKMNQMGQFGALQMMAAMMGQMHHKPRGPHVGGFGGKANEPATEVPAPQT